MEITDEHDEFTIAADVTARPGYLGVACPGCHRYRLELYVDQGAERAVAVKCEKCGSRWYLDPTKAEHVGDYAEHDPLRDGSIPLPDNDPFAGSGGTER